MPLPHPWPFQRRPNQGYSPEQQAEIDRFAAERVRMQLATEPVDEGETEALLRQAYAAVGLTAPDHIHWLDGPLELVAVLGRDNPEITVDEVYRERVPHCVWDDALLDREEIALLDKRVEESVDFRVRQVVLTVRQRVQTMLGITSRWWSGPYFHVPMWDVKHNVGERILRAIGDAVDYPLPSNMRDYGWGKTEASMWHGVRAYDDAPSLSELLFYDTYLAPNAAGALARFNERVSGYWLGRPLALVVRRPQRLDRDDNGYLHGETAASVAYSDGWGFWAWHGVHMPERLIRTPDDALTKDDFFGARNLEVRRVIQERMGARFVWEIGARFVDGGPRGILYEVDLPGDPDRVARYVQITDPTTKREYYLRVPPWIGRAAEAVAWTFDIGVELYNPIEEY